ncbi:leucine-rich repeat domain-containing protein [Thiothrix subterranea]|uniref:Tandem-95 repeat protein n=2 Tax=Thiothrix subterranea TaxID=2735563 RepID=A0ABU0Y411_9GAMM|nr:Ig-like domain-containing protein [Thiothrix subterranea]MDQ5767530.1 tandem-95 repeat protein [Thiothrix subterranea]
MNPKLIACMVLIMALLPFTAQANVTPIATPQAVVVDEDTAIPISLIASDTDTDEKLLTYKITLQPSMGVLSQLKSGSKQLIYTPSANFSGTDSFYFQVSDGRLISKTAKVSITVNPVNDAPVVPSVTTLSTEEDAAKSMTFTGTDIERDTLSYVIHTKAADGQAIIQGGKVTYTPQPNFFGTDSFTYTAFDGKNYSAPGHINVTVIPVNDAPMAQPQTVTLPAGQPSIITLQATDPDNNKLSYQLANSPSPKGSLGTVNGSQVIYTPKAGVSADSFGFTAHDGTVASPPALVTINIQSALTAVTDPSLLQCLKNIAPTAADQKTLVTFSCNGLDLSNADLTQLTYLPNLRSLDLSNTKLANINGLAELKQLTKLNLGSNYITNISALSDMQQLQILNLGFNDISDIAPLSNINSLQELYLDANKLSNLTALSNKKSLLKLYLDDNQVNSIAELSALKNLTHLGLSYNQINSISALSNLKQLQSLALEANDLSNIAALAEFVNLQSLYLSGNLLTDISPLTYLVNMKTLELSFNQIASVIFLQNMVSLINLTLDFNNLTEVTGLTNLMSLQHIDLENNALNTISGLQNLSVVNGLLRLSHNLLLDEDIMLLASMRNSYSLRLEDNCLVNISLPKTIQVYGKSWQFPGSKCGGIAPVAIGKTVEVYPNTATIITLDAYDPNDKTMIFQLDSIAVNGGVLSASVGKLASNQITFFPNLDHLKSAGNFTFSVTNSDGEKSQKVTVQLRVIPPILETCFGKNIPSDEDLLKLQSLSCENKGNNVTDISALPMFLPNLTHLSLGGNAISDYSTLLDFPELIGLSLKGNVLDATALQIIAQLSKLSVLSLEKSQLNDLDINFLAGLTNLTQLYLGGNKITNINPLSQLKRLDVLTLDNNFIGDLTPLASLTSIRTLSLNNNGLSKNQALNLAVLSKLQALIYFEIDNNGLTSINGLENLTNLSVLTVRYNRLATVNNLKVFPQAMTLHLQGNCLSDSDLFGWPSNISLIGSNSSNQRSLFNNQCPVYPQYISAIAGVWDKSH